VAAGLGVVVLGTAGAAAAVRLGEEPPPGWQSDGNVACASDLKRQRVGVVWLPPGVDPIERCRRAWRESGEEEPPGPLFACVYRMDGGREGGALFVVPGAPFKTAAEACAAAGMFLAPQPAVTPSGP
jgi:hypothetical protein